MQIRPILGVLALTGIAALAACAGPSTASLVPTGGGQSSSIRASADAVRVAPVTSPGKNKPLVNGPGLIE